MKKNSKKVFGFRDGLLVILALSVVVLVVCLFWVIKRDVTRSNGSLADTKKQLAECQSGLEFLEGFKAECEQERDELKKYKKRLENLTLNSEAKEKIATYTDETLGIAFDYPEYWGPVTTNFDNAPEEGQFEMFFSGLESGIFLAATYSKVSVEEGFGRGGYWGDQGLYIRSEDDIKNFCQEGKVYRIYPETISDGSCEVFTNSHGITVARHRFVTGTEGGAESNEPTSQYYFYLPGSQFAGIAMSSVRIPDQELNPGIEEDFAKVVDSLRLAD